LRDHCDCNEAVGGSWRVETRVVAEAGKGVSAFVNVMSRAFVLHPGDIVVLIHNEDWKKNIEEKEEDKTREARSRGHAVFRLRTRGFSCFWQHRFVDFICRSANDHARREQKKLRGLQCISERVVECGRREPIIAANNSGDNTTPIL